MKPPRTLLKLSNVSVHNAGFERVGPVSFNVVKGEHWAVIGPNGSGKSSLAEAIAGHAHFSGEIEYAFGKGIADPCSKVAVVSFLMHKQFAAQSDGYFQSRWYPGEEQVTLTTGQILGLDGELKRSQRRLILDTCELMGIGALFERQALHLSTGELRRLLIARALLLSPALLILDEPFVGLDVACRKSVSSALQRVMKSERGPSVIVLTARPWELPSGLNRCLYLKNGRQVGVAGKRSVNAVKFERIAFRKTATGSLPPRSKKESSKTGSRIVDLRRVSISAGGTPVLKDVDWSVSAGDCWAVLGPNGSGKTTLLSLLTGDHPQSFAQDVSLFGKLRSEHHTGQLKARIGHASPDIALHYDGHTNALDFVCTGFFETLGLYNHATAAQERTAKNWLRYFGLESFTAHPFRLLSDGQQRLVLLARALVKHPRLLILDEPCQGLDANARERVRIALNSAAENGATLIVVSHYLDELPRGVTHKLTLKKGCTPKVSKCAPGTPARGRESRTRVPGPHFET